MFYLKFCETSIFIKLVHFQTLLIGGSQCQSVASGVSNLVPEKNTLYRRKYVFIHNTSITFLHYQESFITPEYIYQLLLLSLSDSE